MTFHGVVVVVAALVYLPMLASSDAGRLQGMGG
jgi:hypothetical protein